MAEFKLGRIKFVWKADWTGSTTYYKDDVVRYGGKTYICAVGHTSAADFNTDLEYVPTKWNQMTDGQAWKGDWAISTFYKINDIVKYGGLLYICNDSHTSASTTSSGAAGVETTTGLEKDQAKWTLYAEGFDWKGTWAVFARYKANDLVKYGGYTYVCNTGHTSAATSSTGLEGNAAYWDEFNAGLEYKGAWSGSFVRYKKNDVVKQGAGLWICTQQHTSTASFIADSATYWEQFVEGIEFEDTWNGSTIYQPGDLVRYGGNQYLAKTSHVGTTPTTVSNTDWDLFSEGFKFQSDWSISTSYKVGDVVKQNGYTYLAKIDSPSTTFTVTATSAVAPYTITTSDNSSMVVGKAISFSSTTFGNVAPGATYYVKSLIGGTGFTISTTPGGTTFQPTTATGSMTATVAAATANSTYWAILNSGIKWQGVWTDDVEYVLGDAVRYGNNAYICINNHRSEADDGSTIGAQGGGAANSRPDRDSTGTYWNTLSIGSETSVLSTRGDMVYYGGAGPTRLPVGTEGQILRSNGTDPEWVNWGQSDHTYYVAPHGEDKPFPVNGGTLDKPWKTIRYACEQVDNGPRYPNAQYLLKMNRAFIQREVTEWIDRQISLGGAWAGFDYDEYKCERDTGFLIDRLIHDLGHGGNLKMRAAAQAYVNALSEGPYSTAEEQVQYTKLSTEGTKDVLAFNFMLTVVDSVLSNTSPAVIYQVLNGDNSTATVAQFIDSTIQAEDGVMTDVTELVGIVTTALTDQDTTNLPDRYVPNNLIQVKAGRYRETLPIIVPAETCILGDEVRSVNVSPADSLIDRSDAAYSIASLTRMETIVGQIIAGETVTESAGNAESQDIAWPYASSVEQTDVKRLIRAIGYNMDFRLGTTNKITYTSPTGYNTSYLTGYGDAKTLIAGNKEWFKAEVGAWLAQEYPNLKYSRTTCLRDVGYIVDAFVYDLTYGGNSQAVQAGLAYYEGVGSSLYINSTEKTATLAAYAFLKSLMTAVAVDGTITPLQTEVTRLRGTAGSAGAQTLVSDNMDTMIAIVNGGPSASYTLTDPGTSWVSGALTTAYSTLNSAVSTIQTNTIDYINSNFGDYTYNSALCRRDTGYLIDAAYYDAAFGSNFWAVQNGLAYLRGQSSVVLNYQTAQEIGAINYIKGQAAAALVSNSTAVTRSNAAYTEIIDIFENGLANVDALTYTDTGTANFTNARAQLVTNRAFIISEMVTWMTANAPAYVALSAEKKLICQRDLGYTIDALAYDVNYGGNIATRNVCRSLFNNITGVLVQPVGQQTDSAASYTQLGVICAQIVRETYAGQDTSGTAASATEATRMTTLTGNIVSVITAGNLTGLVAESAPSITWVNAGIQTAVGTLATNKTTIIANTLQFISDTYNSFTYNQAKCSRDVGIILKSVGYDFMFNSNFQSVKAAYSYLRATASEVFNLGQKAVTRSALEYVRTQAIANVGGDTTAIARINTLMQAIDDIIFSGSNEGSVCQTDIRGADHARLQLERNRDFIIAEMSAWILATYPSYSYNIAKCERDVGTIIDALQYDLQYPGNYKSLLTARYYANAVLGNKEEDFYYVRNGCGIRNQTLEGLVGDLTPENVYGTSRVTAGAYVSLDPGWGPDDFRTWITSRSPYIQNNATFGNAAIGQKIDGSLHNGGNKSMVSNDFTQLISDGIGAWVLNNGRAELVSVFTYYSHVGYLAESGGRIRATNGNNSYGDFGSVAEGVDSTETPNTAIIDNKFQFAATVGYVFTDSANQIYNFEFDNAGIDYNSVTWAISGAGTSAAAEQMDEFRDNAVFEVRLLDNVDDSTSAPEADGNFGGYGYISNSNTAQGGTTSQITLAATDGELSTAYIGMKVYVNGGTGAGQFGIIATYNSGTKIATVNKESTGTSGWDHVVPGTTIVSPDASSTYIVEPRVSFTSPTYSSTASTLATSLTYADVEYAELHKTYDGVSGSTSEFHGTAATFTVTKKGVKYETIALKTAGTGYDRLDTITILGTSLGGATPANDLTITVTSINSVTGAIQAFDTSGSALGGNFVAISSGTRTINTSADGVTWTERLLALPSTSSWTSVASGKLTADENAGSFVTGRTYVIKTQGDTVWTTIGAANNFVGTRFVATGAGTGTGVATPEASRIVAVSSSTTVNAWSEDGGVTWTAGGALPASGTWSAVAYGAGRWVAVMSGATSNAYSIDGGATWTAGGALPSSTTWASVTYGGGRFVAIAGGGTIAAYSTDGSSWTAATLPSASDWISVAYGRGRFVAVSNTSGTTGAYSLDGATWVAATLPATASWTKIAYGQGLFFAVSQSTQAASSEDGIVWTSRTTSTAANGFSSITFGNPTRRGTFVAVQRSTASTVATYIYAGATTKARAYVAQNKIYSIKIVEPGSGYYAAGVVVPPTITITDPNNTYEAPTTVRVGSGVLASPNFTNRGTGYVASAADVLVGNGYADIYQSGQYIAVRRLTQRPVAGSNIVFGHLPDQTFKLVNIITLLGSYDGSYTCFLQISPDMKTFSSPDHGTSVTTRIRYSQVRLTGHDFLDIGTGSFDETNYPAGIPDNSPNQANETVESNGGRVFFTSTDQDGNFRVGDLFTIEQSTGVATLNADAFNIAGLQELSLGEVSLGGGSASISEFSTDVYFTQNSDNIVPTQRAIKAYIASQIGGGGASLNVNSVTSGFIYIASNQITTTTGGIISMKAKFNFQSGVVGLPVAWNYFLT